MTSICKTTLTSYRKAIFPFLTASVLAALTSTSALADPSAYVANFLGNSISVVNTANGRITATIAVPGTNPLGVAVSPDARRVYVANGNLSTVSVIDATRNTVIATIGSTGASGVQALAVTPNGKQLYILNGGASTVSVLDTATNTLAANPIVVGGFPSSVAISPDGKRAYVTSSIPPTLSVIDTATNALVAIVNSPLGNSDSLRNVAVSPDGKKIYATASARGDFGIPNVNNLLVFDAATNGLTAIVSLPNNVDGSNPYGLSAAPDGGALYVTDASTGSIWIVDAASNAVSSLALPGAARAIAFTPEGKRAFAPILAADTMTAIDTTSKAIVGSAAVGSAPIAVGIAPAPSGLPFASMSASLSVASRRDGFQLSARFTVASAGDGIRPLTEQVRLLVGPYLVTIPAASFARRAGGAEFSSVIDGARLRVRINPTGNLSYALSASVSGANLRSITNAVPVSFSIGDDAGRISVSARL